MDPNSPEAVLEDIDAALDSSGDDWNTTGFDSKVDTQKQVEAKAKTEETIKPTSYTPTTESKPVNVEVIDAAVDEDDFGDFGDFDDKQNDQNDEVDDGGWANDFEDKEANSASIEQKAAVEDAKADDDFGKFDEVPAVKAEETKADLEDDFGNFDAAAPAKTEQITAEKKSEDQVDDFGDFGEFDDAPAAE